MDFIPSALRNWIPYKITVRDGEAYSDWFDLGDQRLIEPFFEDTLSTRRQVVVPKSLRPVSLLDILPEWGNAMDSIAPTAFIFHVSRCGSTLVSQLLSMDESNICLSEVPFFDELLRLPYKLPGIPLSSIDKYLYSAIQMHGQRRTGEEQHLFIKTDCWHIFFYERLRKLYPGIPFILLYRSPDEVLRSQQKRKGIQAVPGIIEPQVMGLTDDDTITADLDLYFSKVMEKIFAAFYTIAKKDDNVLLANYNEGIMTMMEKITAFFNIQIAPAMLDQWKERTQFHGKYPKEVFEKEKKASEMPAFIEESMSWYKKLEEIRK